jgi:hypothetical protein
MGYKVLDIYKDLPLTNCGDCGKAGCFAFASAVYLDGLSPSVCPHLGPERCAEMEAKLGGRKSRDGGKGGKRPARSEQALESLRTKVSAADLATLAMQCGGEYRPGPPEGLLVEFLGAPYRITRDDVLAEDGEPLTVWVKIFLFIYATRASGAPASGNWVAYRELPNTVSKSRTFEATEARLAAVFDGRRGDLEVAAKRLAGRAVDFGSADRAFVFTALPRVPLLLLFWDGDEEFPARISLLLDRNVLDYLDQEAIVFLIEAFASRIRGLDLTQVMP